MVTVNVHEAKTHLSRLLAQIGGGGRKPSSPETASRSPGSCAAKSAVSGSLAP